MNKTIEKSSTRRRTTATRERNPMTFVARGSKEWHAAWNGLVQLTGDDDFTARDPESHESWQYMDSVQKGGRWQHEFRHRWHPRLRRRLVVVVPASDTFRPQKESIH